MTWWSHRGRPVGSVAARSSQGLPSYTCCLARGEGRPPPSNKVSHHQGAALLAAHPLSVETLASAKRACAGLKCGPCSQRQPALGVHREKGHTAPAPASGQAAAPAAPPWHCSPIPLTRHPKSHNLQGSRNDYDPEGLSAQGNRACRSTASWGWSLASSAPRYDALTREALPKVKNQAVNGLESVQGPLIAT